MNKVETILTKNHKQENFNKEKEFISKNGKWISHVDL